MPSVYVGDINSRRTPGSQRRAREQQSKSVHAGIIRDTMPDDNKLIQSVCWALPVAREAKNIRFLRSLETKKGNNAKHEERD